MNKFLWINRKMMSWGNFLELEELNKLDWENTGFWESLGWGRTTHNVHKGKEVGMSETGIKISSYLNKTQEQSK